MATATRPITADELLQMPDDGFRYELVRGELRKTVPPGYLHGEYSLAIGSSLNVYVRANRLGKASTEIGFLLAPDHVRAPDAAFVRLDRREAAGEQHGYFPGPPDLAVEVISPNDRYTDVDEKVADYLDAGTIAVVVVNPRTRTVRVHRSPTDIVTLTESDTLEVDDVVPGWRMPVREIFE